MKRIGYIILLLVLACMHSYKAHAHTEATLMDSLDVYGFNDVQKKLIHTEVTYYTEAITRESGANMDAFKAKMKDMFTKLRDGFRVYRLAREPKVADRIAAFDSLNTGLNVYVFAYVEGAFLNNIFQRLSQAYYHAARPDTYVSLTYKFSKAPAYSETSPLFLPIPDVKYSEAVRISIGNRLSELSTSTSAKGAFTNTGAYNIVNDDAVLSDHFYKSVDDVLKELAGVYVSQESSAAVSNGMTLTAAATFVTPWGEPFILPKGAIILHSCNAYMYSDNYFLHDFSYSGIHYSWGVTGINTDGYVSVGTNVWTNTGSFESPVKITGAVRNVVLVDQNPFTTEIAKADLTFEKAKSVTLTLKEAVLGKSIQVSSGNRSLKHFKDVSPVVTIGKSIQEIVIASPCDKPVKTSPISNAAPDPAIDAYVKDGKLQKWLATQGISGSVWVTNCKTGKGYVINGTQTTASTTSKTEADAIVKGKKFNGDIGISACYDPDTKQWTINHAFKDGVLTPPTKYAGELEKLKATSDEYVENVINKKNAEANNTTGTGSSSSVSTDPDFKYTDLGILEAVLVVKDFTKQIVNTAKVPEEYWDDTKPEYKTSPVNVPALFCGAGDQGLENATELVQLLDLGLTMATEPETASQMWSSIKNIKWQDVQKLAGSATGYDNYSKGGCFAKYQGGKHAVVIAVGIGAVVGKSLKTILSKLDEGVEGAIKKADDDLVEAVGKNGDDLDENITKNKDVIDDPWNLKKQKLGLGPDSKVLGKNLVAVGKVRPPNSAAHHIVPGGETYINALEARKILIREGIDINEASNGVFLPKNSKYVIDDAIPHSRVHTNKYYDELVRRLNETDPSRIREELKNISDELLNGTFPYN